MKLSRLLISLAALLFGTLHALLGLTAVDVWLRADWQLLALAIYLVCLYATVLGWRGLKLPAAQALANLTAALAVPALVNASLATNQPPGNATWYVAGIGTLMAITAVRQQRAISWIGVGSMILLVLAWGGPALIFTSGLVGALLYVFAAQASSYALEASAKAADLLTRQVAETEASTAAQTAARAERQILLAEAMGDALPLLTRIRDSHGQLTADEIAQARLLEASMRDEIRGRALMHPELKNQIRLARLRGVEVQVLDDGGLVGATQSERAALLGLIAGKISQINAGKIVIRAARGNGWRVSVAAIRKDSEAPDLFLRL